VRAVDAVVLGVEKKTVAKLQESRTVKKIVMLDKHVAMTFAGNNCHSYSVVVFTMHDAQMSRTPRRCPGAY
jgi:20S proteasome subunit alpha 4